MREIYNSLTEQNGAGVLKPLLSEPDLEKLRQNPFHITKTNIQVKRHVVRNKVYVSVKYCSK